MTVYATVCKLQVDHFADKSFFRCDFDHDAVRITSRLSRKVGSYSRRNYYIRFERQFGTYTTLCNFPFFFILKTRLCRS